jgi:small subunit ribosomal protein S21
LLVKVQGNNVEKALKVLKNKLSKEGVFKELKNRRYYEKPSREARPCVSSIIN